MASDIGDSHELNDDRCLVISSRDFGDSGGGPLGEYLLCLLADGATGSTFAVSGDVTRAQAGWRASQLAQAAFVESFLGSREVDVMDRLRDGLRAADRVLVDSPEGTLSTTLTALFVSADGTACAASIGDSVLLVLPPTRKTPGERRLKKLGYEDTTAVGSGDTTLSFVDETSSSSSGGPARRMVGRRRAWRRARFSCWPAMASPTTCPPRSSTSCCIATAWNGRRSLCRGRPASDVRRRSDARAARPANWVWTT